MPLSNYSAHISVIWHHRRHTATPFFLYTLQHLPYAALLFWEHLGSIPRYVSIHGILFVPLGPDVWIFMYRST
jgi:hypothetical protein